MSLMKIVVEMVNERGSATADDLYPELAGKYTRAQVISALQNARHAKRIDCDGHRARASGPNGGQCGIYRALERVVEDDGQPVRRIVSASSAPVVRVKTATSVWDFAQQAQAGA